MKMTRKDMDDACKALFAWLESQEIELTDAVPVLGTLMVSIVVQIARASDKDVGEAEAVIHGCLSKLFAMIEKESHND